MMMRAVPVSRRPGGWAAFRFQHPRWLLVWLVSFETLFGLFLYSNVFQSVLPPLPVDLTLVFAAASVASAGLIILREGVYVRGLVVVCAVVPFLGWMLFSLGWTPSRVLAKTAIFGNLGINLWALVAGGLVMAHRHDRVQRFLTVLLALATVTAGLGLAIYLLYGSFKYAGWQDAGRVYNVWGRAAAMGAVIAFVGAFTARLGSLRQFASAGALALIVTFVLVAGSRSALLVAVLPCLLVFAVYAPWNDSRRLKLPAIYILAVVVLAAVGAAVSIYLANGGDSETLDRFGRLMEQAENPDMVMGPNRFKYYAGALQLWFEAPFMGHGVAGFSMRFLGREVPGTHAHNIFLEILTDLGLIGLALFLSFLVVALRPVGLRRLRGDPAFLCVFLLFVGRFTSAMVGAELAYQQALFAFLGLLAMRPPKAAAPLPDPRRRPEGAAAENTAAGGGPGR